MERSSVISSREAHAVFALDLLRFRDRRAQSDGQIVAEMIAADGHGPGVAHHAAGIDDQLRRAAADIEQAAAQFAFVLREHGFRRGQRLERGVADHDAGAIDGRDHVLRGGHRSRDDMHVYFQLLSDHSDGIADVVLVIDQKILREHVQDFAIVGQGDGARGVHGTAHVLFLDIARASAQRNAASAIHAAYVAAGNCRPRRIPPARWRRPRLPRARGGWSSRRHPD